MFGCYDFLIRTLSTAPPDGIVRYALYFYTDTTRLKTNFMAIHSKAVKIIHSKPQILIWIKASGRQTNELPNPKCFTGTKRETVKAEQSKGRSFFFKDVLNYANCFGFFQTWLIEEQFLTCLCISVHYTTQTYNLPLSAMEHDSTIHIPNNT